MFYTFGIDYHFANIKKVSGIRADCICTDTIKSGYNRFLGANLIFNGAIDWSSPVFVNFSQSIRYSKRYFNEKQQYFATNLPEIQNMISSGYFNNVFSEMKLENRNVFKMADILLKVIIINNLNSYTNGTTEDFLGLAVIDYKLFFNKIDFQELIFHQVIHMLTYLDDIINLHLPNHLKSDLVSSTLVHKAGGNKFPLYIIFHSYLVGVEILLYRLHMNRLDFEGNYHGPTNRIIERCIQGRMILDDHLDKFTGQGRLILDMTHDHLKLAVDQYRARK